MKKTFSELSIGDKFIAGYEDVTLRVIDIKFYNNDYVRGLPNFFIINAATDDWKRVDIIKTEDDLHEEMTIVEEGAK